jgi:hypothetical protein
MYTAMFSAERSPTALTFPFSSAARPRLERHMIESDAMTIADFRIPISPLEMAVLPSGYLGTYPALFR